MISGDLAKTIDGLHAHTHTHTQKEDAAIDFSSLSVADRRCQQIETFFPIEKISPLLPRLVNGSLSLFLVAGAARAGNCQKCPLEGEKVTNDRGYSLGVHERREQK